VSGCVAPEDYIALMKSVGFVDIRLVGYPEFWTSKSTRAIDFVARKAD
jgi:hypothetical protein